MDNVAKLLPIIKYSIGGRKVNAVDGTYLYNFLEIKSRFNDWVGNRIKKYQFIENQDFVSLTKTLVSGGNKKEYTFTVNMAKELCMVENNDQGRIARKYFIDCEQKLVKAQQAIIDMAKDPIIGVRIKQIELENRVLELEAKATTKDENYYTISGFASLRLIKVPYRKAIQLGKEATKLSKERGIYIGKEYDAKYGRINTYHTHILNIVFTNFKNS